MVLNGPSIKTMFNRFYSEIWNNQNDVVVDDKVSVKKSINHIMESIELLSRMEKISK